MANVDAEARRRIQTLEERVFLRDREVHALASHLSLLSCAVDALRAEIVALRNPAGPAPPPGPAAPRGISCMAAGIHPRIDSVILRELPAFFGEFCGKCFAILWRGSRDGFGRRAFHQRCHGHANTLAVIADTDGTVFGWFTPVAWESR
jgi:hypothetical protein